MLSHRPSGLPQVLQTNTPIVSCRIHEARCSYPAQTKDRGTPPPAETPSQLGGQQVRRRRCPRSSNLKKQLPCVHANRLDLRRLVRQADVGRRGRLDQTTNSFNNQIEVHQITKKESRATVFRCFNREITVLRHAASRIRGEGVAHVGSAAAPPRHARHARPRSRLCPGERTPARRGRRLAAKGGERARCLRARVRRPSGSQYRGD